MQTQQTAAVSDPVVQVRNVSVTYDMERGESRVLDRIDVDVQRNEILGVVGESGSGKSMFASSLLDAVPQPGVTTGEITFHSTDGDEVDVLDLNKGELKEFRWEEVAMVFQGAMSSFNPTMSVGDHFRETLRVHGYDVEEGMERTDRLLSDLYLDAERVRDSYPHELSGGMQQRALIALSLVLEPQVLVMDEPTAALDLLMQRSIIGLIDDLAESYDLTIVFITHDLPLVANLADRLAVMYAFDFVEVGDAYEVLTAANHPYTRALLNATPNLDTPREQMRPIDGSAPDPVNVPTGCSYHPRCPLADEECVEEDPPLEDVGDGEHVACHHYESVPETIPLTIQEVRTDE